MRLSEAAVRQTKPKDKQFKLIDGNGLHLLIHPNGGRYWQFRYRFGGKEKSFSLGMYPEVGLRDARNGRDDARKVLRNGEDPSQLKKLTKLRANAPVGSTLEEVAREWLDSRSQVYTPRYLKRVLQRLENDVFPTLGSQQIAELTPLEILQSLQKIEKRGAMTMARRIHQLLGQIFRYAVASGKVERDITADIRDALKPSRKKNFKRLNADELPEFLHKLNYYDGDLQTQIATKLLMLTFVRTSELRGALWSEFNFDKAEWRIPSKRMKMRNGHVVPLSSQAKALFLLQHKITGNQEHVFPNQINQLKEMSENTILYAI